MASHTNDGKTALLVVDVQVGVMRNLWDAPRVITKVASAVGSARAAEIPVVWVLHTAEHLPKGSDEWQLVPELIPVADEPVIDKEYNSAFANTELESQLQRLKTSHILLCGAATNWCIRATAYAALDRGYDLTLIADAHTTADMESEDGRAISAKNVIEELNIVMQWLSYPECRNAATPLGKVDLLASD